MRARGVFRATLGRVGEGRESRSVAEGLFFAPDSEWRDAPPAPVDWFAQLLPSIQVGLDPARSFWEFDFHAELERLAEKGGAKEE